MKYTLLTIFLGLMLTTDINSQESVDSSYWQAFVLAEVGWSIGQPTGPLQRNVDQTLLGINTAILFNIHRRPGIFAGIGLTNYRFDFNRDIYPLPLDGITDNYDVNSWAALTSIQGVFRFVPRWHKRLSPYAEAYIGPRRMGVKSEIFALSDEIDEPIQSFFQDQDWSLSYGGAIGAYYRLTSWINTDILLSLSVHYTPGTTLDYYVLNDNPPFPSYDVLEAYSPKFSTSDLWHVNIGLTFAFGSTFAAN